MSESEQEFQGLLAHIREHFTEALSPPSAEEVAEAREHLQAAFPTHDALLAQAARLESSNHRLVRALDRLTQEITTLKLGLASMKWSDAASIDANLEFIQHDSQPLLLSAMDQVAKLSVKKKRTAIGKTGGDATAKRRKAEDEAILRKYRAHAELHQLSGSRAADHIIAKYPELTMDMGIAHRRVADLIRKEQQKGVSR